MVVRKSWVAEGKDSAGYIDAAEFEEIEKQGDAAVDAWIDGQLIGTPARPSEWRLRFGLRGEGERYAVSVVRLAPW